MKERLTIKERVRITKRGIGILNQYCPGLAGGKAMSAVLSAIQPLVSVWISARIINELAGNRSMKNIVVQDMMFVLADNEVYCRHLRGLYEYLDIPNRKYDGKLPVEKPICYEKGNPDYEMEFCNVSFHYPGTEEYAIRNLSLKFKLGERLAVVGKMVRERQHLLRIILHQAVAMGVAANREVIALTHQTILVRKILQKRIAIVQVVTNPILENRLITVIKQMIHIMQRIIQMRKTFMMTILMILMDMKMQSIIMTNGENKMVDKRMKQFIFFSCRKKHGKISNIHNLYTEKCSVMNRKTGILMIEDEPYADIVPLEELLRKRNLDYSKVERNDISSNVPKG